MHFSKTFWSVAVILVVIAAGILIVKLFYHPVYMINDTGGPFPPPHDTGPAPLPVQ